MKRVLLFIGIVMFSAPMLAQDLHFSQFYNSPLTINPALTGKEDASYRVNANYRNQWYTLDNSKPIATYAVSVDGRILDDVIPNYDNLGIGLQAFYDTAGDGQYTNASIMPSVAYHKALGYNHKIAAGLQLGLGNKSVDFGKLLFENQYIGIGFDPNLPTGENVAADNVNHFDMNGGVYYSYRSNDDSWNAFIGGSLYHVNAPDIAFLDGSTAELPERSVINGGLTYIAPNGIVISPSALIMNQSGAHELNVGTIVGKQLGSIYNPTGQGSTAAYGGVFWRKDDAIIGKAGLQFDNMNIGLSGDFANSEIKRALGLNSAFELSFTLLGFPETDDKPIFCPSF
ncbi:MAG: PorP/SprF family type IX secretion system membrane protein [Saprospiraceae bacterium]|nr:PorP/SprF family type IX secretion system membrane protein [Saprospiraceae bacterium]